MTQPSTAASPTSTQPTPTRPTPTRHDTRALWGGVIFSFLFCVLIWALGGWLSDIPHLPDQGASWYFWKLPDATTGGAVTAWGFYALHQLGFWGLIFYAQTRVGRYTSGLHPVNRWALGLNALFITLHLVQTHIWYDGLAQYTSIWASQGSVILLLVWVLLMENRRRGLFFGAKVPFPQSIMNVARRYHGYVFAWAIVYTFWFHPMEATSGHLIGFFYTFLLMLQGSLMLTRVHTNRYWTFTLEFLVLLHGTLVAVMNANGLWPMFGFGFAGIFVITQMHGLGWSRLTRAGVLAAYIGAVLWVYSDRGWAQLNEIIRIPFIDYLAVFVLAGLFGLGLMGARLVQRMFGRTA